MKIVIRIFDQVLGYSLIGLSGWVLYIAIHEMIYDAAGWYDFEDWLWSIGGSLVFMMIGYSGIKFVYYNIRTWILERRINKLIESWDNDEQQDSN